MANLPKKKNSKAEILVEVEIVILEEVETLAVMETVPDPLCIKQHAPHVASLAKSPSSPKAESRYYAMPVSNAPMALHPAGIRLKEMNLLLKADLHQGPLSPQLASLKH
jgi:hypothetical protein